MPSIETISNEEATITNEVKEPLKEEGKGDGFDSNIECSIGDKDDNFDDMPPLEDLSGNDSEKYKNKKIIIDDEKESPPEDEDGWMDILGSGELKKRGIKKGNGISTRPERSNWVVINLTGKLEDGTVFEKREKWKMILGDLEVVSGLDLAIALMETGEVAEIVTPPRFGYGDLGREPEVPPNSVLYFEVELLETYEAKTETDLPVKERQSIGDSKRERGNFWYSRGDFSNAIHCYRRALDFLDDLDNQNYTDPPKELQNLLETRLKVHNNLAAAHLKMEAFEAALKSVDFVIKVQPNNVKALFRKGKILAAQGNVSEAVEQLKRALKLEPQTKIIHQELAKLMSKKKTQDQAEKAMYQRMFRESNEKKISSPSKFGNWTLVVGGALAVAAGVAIYRHLHMAGI